MPQTSDTPALDLFFSATSGHELLHLTAHMAGKTEWAGEQHMYVQGLHELFTWISLTLAHFKTEE